MSSYVNFYLKNDNSISYLFGYSRSSSVYEVFQEVMGNNSDVNNYCNSISKSDFIELADCATCKKRSYLAIIAECEKAIQDLANWNNSITEKMELYSEYQYRIREVQEEVEAYNDASVIYGLLAEMLSFNPDNIIILGGIDCYASREEEEADQ